MRGSDPSVSSRISLSRSALQWWSDVAGREGWLSATRRLLAALWEFIRESTPERRRQRYGDADYDWEHRVNTTSAAVSWRDRLLGAFNSPYQPTESVLFHEMLDALHQHTRLDFHDFVFLDLGSGKGRTLLMASDYTFRRIVGVELLPALHQDAQENLSKYRSESQKCFALESICADATEFPLPAESTVLYLFNPFPESGLKRMIANLDQSLREHPRVAYVLYHNPVLDHVLGESTALKKIGGTHQYSIYESRD
ncbi:MAG TPA: class I SAM-dependent methyltransferase [Candidatus Acidoferrum sp.]|jgi:SAM-dependent methyltransferase|nr:class I SAM-dependent methyltransferase [Candidatus Acidoferrum sp.]